MHFNPSIGKVCTCIVECVGQYCDRVNQCVVCLSFSVREADCIVKAILLLMLSLVGSNNSL